MKFILMVTLLPVFSFCFLSCLKATKARPDYRYQIHKLRESMPIDASWQKSQWQNVPALAITNFMGAKPKFLPQTLAKVLYDDANLYVIFRVEDQYVRAVTNKIQGKVWEDACVEFFFAPDVAEPLKYFNVEMNCGGTALLHYNRVPGIDYMPLAIEDVQQLEISHSLPVLIDPERTEPVTWTLEYRLPIAILEKYTRITKPGKGVIWRANFQKCAENNSHPHWLTWAKIDYPKPRFHLPQFFGEIEFLD